MNKLIRFLANITKRLMPQWLFEAIEQKGHGLEAICSNILNGFPTRKLKVIGVTGTDGKSSTSFMIYQMLKETGYKVGLMTTIALDAGQGLEPNQTRLTSITSWDTFAKLRRMRRNGLEWVIFEITSHALAQNRTEGVAWHLGVMTNITHEHLDYHKTFENYRDAKRKLFKKVAANRHGLQTGIVNAEDPSAQLFADDVPHVITYGIKQGELRASQIKTTPANSVFMAKYRDQAMSLTVNLPGSFNIYNALAAAGAGLAIGLKPAQVSKGIAALKSVEGRMNSIEEGQDFAVVVDYAHTPESFEKVFKEIKPLTKGRLIVVFGSAGRRDHAKRPLQGEMAGKYADVVYVAEEDDRDEDGQLILDEIAVGAERSGKVRQRDLFLIHDRAEAIRAAIATAQAGDTVLLLGKGHETSILTNQGKKPWNEAATARQAIKDKA